MRRRVKGETDSAEECTSLSVYYIVSACRSTANRRSPKGAHGDDVKQLARERRALSPSMLARGTASHSTGIMRSGAYMEVNSAHCSSCMRPGIMMRHLAASPCAAAQSTLAHATYAPLSGTLKLMRSTAPGPHPKFHKNERVSVTF